MDPDAQLKKSLTLAGEAVALARTARAARSGA
jgi:hypothetical protein